jgi:hypothetical protein
VLTMSIAQSQLIQFETTSYLRPDPASDLLGLVKSLANRDNVMLGVEQVRQVFYKIAFGFLQNLTNNPE